MSNSTMLRRGGRRDAQTVRREPLLSIARPPDPASDRAASLPLRTFSPLPCRSARFSMLLARFANFSLSKSRPQIANRFALARIASILRSSASRLRRAASSASASAARASLNGRSKHHKRPSRRNQVVVATASRNARSCDTSTNAPRYALRIRLEDPHRRKIEMVRRFVEQQQVRFGDDRAREHQSVLLAARQLAGPQVERSTVRCRVRRAALRRASARRCAPAVRRAPLRRRCDAPSPPAGTVRPDRSSGRADR